MPLPPLTGFSLTFAGIVEGGSWYPPLPPASEANGTYKLDVYADNIWRFVDATRFCAVRLEGGLYKIDFVFFGFELYIFYGETPDLINQPAVNVYPAGAVYTGGTSRGSNVQEAQEVADLFGIPYTPKTFYEPVPLASPGKSFRYASEIDASRVYIRTE